LQPGVLLTFDDESNILHWVEQIPLLAKYDARVTFFVDAPDRLSENQIEGLRKLAQAGHEIGNHGFRHVRAPEVIEKSGLHSYLESEIAPAEAAFRSLGFSPVSFAYPFSQNDATSDGALQTLFRHARTGSGIPDGMTLEQCDVFFTPVEKVEGRFCLTGKGIDLLTRETLEDSLVPALERAKKRREILVLYAHNIVVEAPSHFVSPEALEGLLQKIKALELRTYRFSDLPSHYGKAREGDGHSHP
jgi:peptidoglycan/xylan/chitin deacetylase (PgdA/CDA1 family)